MYLLDTDHVSLLARGGADASRILSRLTSVPPSQIAVSIVTYEEQMRGWLAEIASARIVQKQVAIYSRLNRMLGYYCATPVLLFNEDALMAFQDLWPQRVRIGTMDLKIASIAIANNATIVTRNSTDFGRVPGLIIDGWS